MIAHSPEASISSVVVRICGSIGATLFILLTVLAIVRPDMLPSMHDVSTMMHRLATPW